MTSLVMVEQIGRVGDILKPDLQAVKEMKLDTTEVDAKIPTTS